MSLEKKIATAFLVALLITLAIGFASCRNIQLFVETNEEVERSYRILAQLETIFSLLKYAESSVRGYSLTGNEVYLQPYSDSGEIVAQATELRNWVRTSDQQKRMALLIPLIRKRLDQLQENIERRTIQGFDTARPFGLTGDGTKTMEEIRNHLESIEIVENQLLRERKEKQLAASRRTKFTIVSGCVLSMVVVFLATMTMYRDFKIRKQTEERLLNTKARRHDGFCA
jgi:CHASE3 domain sensor protein